MEVCQLTSNPEGNWLRISRGSSPVHLPSTGQGGISMDHSWPMNLPMQGRPQTAQLVVLLIPNTSVGNSPPCPTAFTCRFMSSLSAAVQGSPRSTSICTGVGLFTGIVQFCLPITGRVQPELVESAALLPFSARCKVHSTCRDLSAPSSVGRLRLPPAFASSPWVNRPTADRKPSCERCSGASSCRRRASCWTAARASPRPERSQAPDHAQQAARSGSRAATMAAGGRWG
mmetsp:Transcript_83596/g.245088  ORF Transcript_83596/g.245088 Transcript_83596/m.245088 type:complete len:230 (+) Transcript_83596:113-802(+)